MSYIKLSDIINKLDKFNNSMNYYINCDTLDIIESKDDNLKSEVGNYLPLPSKINEYQIMRDFCYTLDRDIHDLFMETINGKDAIHHFNNLINYFHFHHKWNEFRYNWFYKFARDFCEKHNILYEDDFQIEQIPIYEKEYKIEMSDVDFNKQLKLSTLLSHLQDVASEAVEKIGTGIEVLSKKYNVTWVLIKMHVDILRYPMWGEVIRIVTWPKTTKALDFERDFLVYDSEGNIVIKATTTWVLLDIDKRRIKRTNTIELSYSNVNKSATEYRFNKLKPFGELINSYSKMIGYSDIDINGHLNNTKYIDFIVDCFRFQEHQLYTVKTIEVNFINEALPGDILVLKKDLSKVSNNMIYVQGENNNKISFKAVVEIKKRD